jgi:hypothetical protein
MEVSKNYTKICIVLIINGSYPQTDVYIRYFNYKRLFPACFKPIKLFIKNLIKQIFSEFFFNDTQNV